jgi:hypothetical protein
MLLPQQKNRRYDQEQPPEQQSLDDDGFPAKNGKGRYFEAGHLNVFVQEKG